MEYIKISVEANEEQQEILISKLDDFNAIGFEQMPGELLAYFKTEGFKIEHVASVLKHYKFLMAHLPDENWNAVWESNFDPVTVGSFCRIRAEFHPTQETTTHEIIITPKMSFGTGHHKTTYMMIEAMQDIDFTGKSVFDFGTGTGILAILAGKLGAATITASDIDEWSVRNAKENFEKNGMSRISLHRTSIISNEKFDIILANINRNVLLYYASTLVNILAKKGILLVSGLLKQDQEIIVESFGALQLQSAKQNGNWIALLFYR